MELGEFLRLVLRRWMLVVAAVGLAAGAGWLTLARQAPVFERAMHFIVHPDNSFPKSEMPNAIQSLGENGPVMQTVLGVFQNDRFLTRAATAAGVGELGPEYTFTSSIRPGSNIIDSQLRGPSKSILSSVGGALAIQASDFVALTYDGFSLDPLGGESPFEAVGPRVGQTVQLAGLLGLMLGLGGVLLEGIVKGRRAEVRRRAPAKAERCLATTGKGQRCRNLAVDDRGYCHIHVRPRPVRAAAETGRPTGDGE